MGRNIKINEPPHHNVMNHDGIGKLTSNKNTCAADTPGKTTKAKIITSDPSEGKMQGIKDRDNDGM